MMQTNYEQNHIGPFILKDSDEKNHEVLFRIIEERSRRSQKIQCFRITAYELAEIYGKHNFFSLPGKEGYLTIGRITVAKKRTKERSPGYLNSCQISSVAGDSSSKAKVKGIGTCLMYLSYHLVKEIFDSEIITCDANGTAIGFYVKMGMTVNREQYDIFSKDYQKIIEDYKKHGIAEKLPTSMHMKLYPDGYEQLELMVEKNISDSENFKKQSQEIIQRFNDTTLRTSDLSTNLSKKLG